MQTTHSINDLIVTLYPAGTFSNEAVAKITCPDNEQELFIMAAELRPLGEWLIKCADDIGNKGSVAPFANEPTERESSAIPFDGRPVVYETDDNTSEIELGLHSPF